MEDFKDKRRSNSFVAVIVALIIFVIGGFAGELFLLIGSFQNHLFA